MNFLSVLEFGVVTLWIPRAENVLGCREWKNKNKIDMNFEKCRNSQKPLTESMGDACAKKRNRPDKRKKHSLSAVTVGLKTPIGFLLVEDPVSVLCDTVVDLSSSSSRLCYQQLTTKITELWAYRPNSNRIY